MLTWRIKLPNISAISCNGLKNRFRKLPQSPFCTGQKTATPTSANTVISTNHRPPFLIRVSLVGASVGLTTPLFALGGAFRFWRTYLPKSVHGRIFKYVMSFCIVGGTTKLMIDYVIPFLSQNSNLLAPFALANTACSMFWYSVGEVFLGVDAIVAGRFSLPFLKPLIEGFSFLGPRLVAGPGIAGPVIGALTALTCPFLWPLAFDLCWNKELKKMVSTSWLPPISFV